jgi:hypothetical protein
MDRQNDSAFAAAAAAVSLSATIALEHSSWYIRV